MLENTNKAIAINSLVMYARIGINTILALFTTRFALQALGVMDYGLFSVLGSIISFMGIFNTIMLSTCNRFLAVAIGKGNIHEINKTFNINLAIFVGCAIFMLIVGLPLGHWYVSHHINYDGPIENVIIVYYFSIVGSIVSTLATPYNGLLIAKERFLLFSAVDVILHVIRFAVVLMLIYYFEEKLLIYTVLQALTIAIPALIYWGYCHRTFPEIVSFKIIKDKAAYKDVFKFSGWVAYGAVAFVIRNQAAALLINAFFNTVMNTALGIGNALNHYVTLFANSITQPMQPQITKCYAAGNYRRADDLLALSTKLTFLVMMFVGIPFFVSTEWILQLWLGKVPDYAVNFTILLIIDNIVLSFNSGLSLILFADGRIALYQIIINTLRLFAVVIAYFVLRSGAAPEWLFITYIVFSVMIVLGSQWCVKYTLKYDFNTLIKKAYFPSLLTMIFICPLFLIPGYIKPWIRIIVSLAYYTLIVLFVGLDKHERQSLNLILQRTILKIKNRG